MLIKKATKKKARCKRQENVLSLTAGEALQIHGQREQYIFTKMKEEAKNFLDGFERYEKGVITYEELVAPAIQMIKGAVENGIHLM